MIEYIGDKRTEDIRGKIYFIPPNPDKGFNFGYSLFIPEGCQTNTSLLFHTTNTGGCGVSDGKLAVVNMIKDAQDTLMGLEINVDDKTILEGYSAGSMFVNYFTALHPENIRRYNYNKLK